MTSAGERNKREPTEDEVAGMRWWNAMSPGQRALALRSANTAVVAEAWAFHKTEYRWVESQLGPLHDATDEGR